MEQSSSIHVSWINDYYINPQVCRLEGRPGKESWDLSLVFNSKTSSGKVEIYISLFLVKWFERPNKFFICKWKRHPVELVADDGAEKKHIWMGSHWVKVAPLARCPLEPAKPQEPNVYLPIVLNFGRVRFASETSQQVGWWQKLERIVSFSFQVGRRRRWQRARNNSSLPVQVGTYFESMPFHSRPVGVWLRVIFTDERARPTWKNSWRSTCFVSSL